LTVIDGTQIETNFGDEVLSGEEGGNLVFGKAGERAEFLYRDEAVFILFEFFAYENQYALGCSQAASCDIYNVFCINDNPVRNSIHLIRIGIERFLWCFLHR
jgi:hypothetical protein